MIKEAFPDVPEILLTQDQNDAEEEEKEEEEEEEEEEEDDDGELEEIQSDIEK